MPQYGPFSRFWFWLSFWSLWSILSFWFSTNPSSIQRITAWPLKISPAFLPANTTSTPWPTPLRWPSLPPLFPLRWGFWWPTSRGRCALQAASGSTFSSLSATFPLRSLAHMPGFSSWGATAWSLRRSTPSWASSFPASMDLRALS